jgi:hypothetical protein
MELPYRRQYEGQLLWREQPMEGKAQERQPVMGLPQGEQQMTKLLLRRRQEAELLYRRQYEGQLLWREQPMEGETQERQPVGRLPQEKQLVVRQPQGEVGEGEGASSPLNLDRPPSSSSTEITAPGRGKTQRENQVKEGEETRLLLNLHHHPSCNNSTEIPHARRECQAREGEGTHLLPDLDHSPGSSSSQEIPVHHPGGQLA